MNRTFPPHQQECCSFDSTRISSDIFCLARYSLYRRNQMQSVGMFNSACPLMSQTSCSYLILIDLERLARFRNLMSTFTKLSESESTFDLCIHSCREEIRRVSMGIAHSRPLRCGSCHREKRTRGKAVDDLCRSITAPLSSRSKERTQVLIERFSREAMRASEGFVEDHFREEQSSCNEEKRVLCSRHLCQSKGEERLHWSSLLTTTIGTRVY